MSAELYKLAPRRDQQDAKDHVWNRHRISPEFPALSSRYDDLFFAPAVYSHVSATVPRIFRGDREWARLLLLSPDLKPANREDPHHAAIEARVKKLRGLALESGEPFNEESAELLLEFCHELAATIKPAIFLLGNGNLRTLWENEEREQIGLQFLQDGEVQYVILHKGRKKMLKSLGTEESGPDLKHRVNCLGLRRLWFRGER